MKKILITIMACSLSEFLFAQQPFVSFQPVYAQPMQALPPRPRYSDPMDPLGLGRGAVRVQSTSVQKEHFGMILGSRYDLDGIARDFKEHFRERADFGSSGDFFQIRVYSKCSKEDGLFESCTMDFHKGRFWKISYQEMINNPREFANKLENKLINYSISETEYEYKCGDVYIEFDGEDLRYVSESVTKAVAGY